MTYKLSSAPTAIGPATPAQLPSIIAAGAAFVQRVDETFPAPTIPTVVHKDSPAEFVRLGMAISTLREFLEQPQLGAMDVPVTVGIGVAQHAPPKLTTPEQLVAVTDKALYRAKHNGRNRVELGTAADLNT